MKRKKRLITGIHNYCDRWCERCDFTDSCKVFSEEAKANRRHQRRGEDPHDMDVAMADVSRSLRRAMRLAVRGAKRMGIDLEEIAQQAAKEPDFDHSRVDDHPLSREGMCYLENLRELTRAVGEDFNASADDLNQRAAFMQVHGEAQQLDQVHNAVEVLNWDSTLVAVKIKRAVEGLFEDGDDQADGGVEADDDDFHLQDAEATAALVLRCLDRDKQALLTIYDWNKDYQDAAVDLLAKAERMTRAIKQLFPGSARYKSWPHDTTREGDNP